MKKICLLVCLLLIVTGCTSNYEIYFGEEINENIIFEYDSDLSNLVNGIEGDSIYVEKELMESDIPAFKDFNDYYNKQIDIKNGKTKISLDYDYTYENFENSYLINQCFQYSNFINDNGFYYVSLGGFFDCFGGTEFTLKIKSDYQVLRENADSKKDGYYIWNIENINPENKVELQISRTVLAKNKGFKISFKVICWFLLFAALGGVFILKKKFEQNNEF